MLAEILSPVPPAEQGKVTALIDKRFLVAPFDAPAAKKCGELLYKSFKDTELIQYRADNAVPKQKLKYDCMIAAICIVRKVDCLYTHDVTDMQRFCDGQILVKDMPIMSQPAVQNSLFKDLPLDYGKS